MSPSGRRLRPWVFLAVLHGECAASEQVERWLAAASRVARRMVGKTCRRRLDGSGRRRLTACSPGGWRCQAEARDRSTTALRHRCDIGVCAPRVAPLPTHPRSRQAAPCFTRSPAAKKEAKKATSSASQLRHDATHGASCNRPTPVPFMSGCRAAPREILGNAAEHCRTLRNTPEYSG